ncbi:MAG: glycosyltransferase family 87 protein [Tepidisphaeraceae bacterium]
MSLQLLRPAPTRKRLWQMTTLLALLTLTFAIGNAVQPKDRAVTGRMLGHDFLAFYTAGTFAREGRSAELYDLSAVAAFQSETAAKANLDIAVDFESRKFGPWWNPPFYAWVFAPLTYLSYSQALAVWTAFNLACLAGAIAVLMKTLVPAWIDTDAAGRPVDWRTTGLVPFALLLSMPFVQAISHGQNTPGSLLLLSLVTYFWRNKRALLAGAFCGLLMYKPQLSALVAVVLIGSLGFRALVGLTLVGSGLVLLTQLTMPGLLVHYLHQMPLNLRYMQIDHPYIWERHATLAGFWRLLLQGREAGEMWLSTRLLTVGSVVTVGGLLGWAIWSHRRVDGQENCFSHMTQRTWRDRLIAATVCCAPLVMPFYFDYDLLLLAVPAVLLSAETLVRPIDPKPADKLLVGCWFMLYGWMLFNPGLANVTHVNGTVILLTLTAVAMTRRATRPKPVSSSVPQPLTVSDEPMIRAA